jgi:hypothetical protein
MTPSPVPPSSENGPIAESFGSTKGGSSGRLGSELVDLEHPWLGLESFGEETRRYFFGRDAEIDELRLRLRSHPLLVFYGQSGLGKTSLLTAGLIPRLREDGHRPLLLRLRFDDAALNPGKQIVASLDDGGVGDGVPRPSGSPDWVRRLGTNLGVEVPDDDLSRLWLRLHYRHERSQITHLIVDQFEEVFTLGATVSSATDKVRDSMAVLIQGAIPDPIARLIADHETFLDEFELDSIPVRVILSMRDDYVYALNRWRRHLTTLGQNTFELHPLRGLAAYEAVFNPGQLRCQHRDRVAEATLADTGLPPIIDADTARRIVRFVAGKGPDTPIEDIEAVPPILSLLCRELNERRFVAAAGPLVPPAVQITFHESDTESETIITAFYERCVKGRPEAVRMFIEEELVGLSGARLAQDERSVLRIFEEGYESRGCRADGFGDAQAARACLADLVDQRLLSTLVGNRYELIHDLLAQVVERSRTARRDDSERRQAEQVAREAREAELARERERRGLAEERSRLAEEERKTSLARLAASRRQARVRNLLLVVAVAMAVLAAFQWRRAAVATREAELARSEIATRLNRERYWNEVDKLCTEIFHRMNQFRDINKLTGPPTRELFELYTALPKAFPSPKQITPFSAEFEKTPTAAVVSQLEMLTLSDNTLRPIVARIRGEHDAALSGYRDGDRVAAIQALQRQAQELIECRSEVENRLLQKRQ